MTKAKILLAAFIGLCAFGVLVFSQAWWVIAKIVAAGPAAPPRAQTAAVYFPQWSKEARVAGVYFDPDDTTYDLTSKIVAAKNQNVSAIVADCPLGSEYTALNDTASFSANLNLMKRVNAYAHAKGLKVIWYLTSLELSSEDPARNPAKEHPDWPQLSITGQTIAFSDISSGQEFWLDKGTVDVWLSPDSPYKTFFLNRVKAMAATAPDGFWLDTAYLQYAIGSHDDLWPSFDPYSTASYKNKWGSDPPRLENWDDPNWLQWIAWRHEQIKKFVVDVKKAAKSVKLSLIFFEENWDCDTSGSTNYANDPTSYFNVPDLSTGHEIGTINDRIDLGGTGMAKATLRNWQDFNTMIRFTRAVDDPKPSWILTYGYKSNDAKKLASVIVSNGANYYETRGPEMADTVGALYRKNIFAWIKSNSRYIYNTTSQAKLALLYSPINRDFIDGGSGDVYDTQDSVFFKQYRDTSAQLQNNRVPFDILIEQKMNSARLAKYKWLILPNISFMSAGEARIIKAFTARGGKVVMLGENGAYDEWGHERESLAGLKSFSLAALIRDQRALFGSLPQKALANFRIGSSFRAVHLTNLTGKNIYNLKLTVKLPVKCLKSVMVISPDSKPVRLKTRIVGNKYSLTLPSLKIYSVIVFTTS